MAVKIHQIRCLTDNYAYLIQDESTNLTAVIDPSEAEPILKTLHCNQMKLNFILNTHHHYDHVDGNPVLNEQTGAEVYCSQYDLDRRRVPRARSGLKDEDEFQLGATRLRVIEIPGHTLGHMALWSESDRILFTGDTLFGLGCGRLFEGTYEQMWRSLDRLMRLPDETLVYCGHEYTLNNCKFALSIEPDHEGLKEIHKQFTERQSRAKAIVPTTLGFEKTYNPFLKCGQTEFKLRLGLDSDLPDQEVFRYLRTKKDRW